MLTGYLRSKSSRYYRPLLIFVWLISTCCTSSDKLLPLYVHALIPVNTDGIRDLIRNVISASSSSSSSSSSPSIPLQPSLRSPQKVVQSTDSTLTATTPTTKCAIRIQKTSDDELSEIASFLASASQQLATPNNSFRTTWQSNIDLLFAKSDIEALLRRRWRILNIGQTASVRVKRQFLQQQQQLQSKDGTSAPQQQRQESGSVQHSHEYLKYLWSSSDDLRTEIALAASETGEDTIWKHHTPMVVTPSSSQWFNHVQMSAVMSTSQTKQQSTAKVQPFTNFPLFFNQVKQKDARVVGFCEVAMISNPMYVSSNATVKTCEAEIMEQNDCIISILDQQHQHQSDPTICNYCYYTPAIANLAVASNVRRVGIATKLLQRAERYVARYWMNTKTLGLYVSSDNLPAIQLYEKCGYHKVMTVSSSSSTSNDRYNDRTSEDNGTMWYMSKRITKM
jgi:Acetyltransferase (GNAT) family